MSDSEFDFSDDAAVSGDQHASASKKRLAEESVEVARERPAKRSKKKSKRRKLEDDEDIDGENSVSLSIGRMDNQLVADHFARQMKRFEPDLDLVSLEDRRLPATSFIDTSDWSNTRDLPGLPGFIERYSGLTVQKLKAAPEAKGSPHTLVVAAAGIRAADIVRTLRVFQGKQGTIAKMFAKHIRLTDAIEFTKSHRISFGVGTPQRIGELIKSGALSVQRTTRIVVDASWVNAKKRGILDLAETEIALSRLLTQLKDRLESGGDEAMSILVY